MLSKSKIFVVTVAAAGVGAGVFGLTHQGIAQSTSGTAQSTGGDVVGELASNEGIFVDGKTFKIVRGKAKGDPSAQIAKMGAKEVGPGAIVFRYGDKLYLVEGSPQPTPQAMKNFQDNWAVGYMKAVKDFQDNWAVGYMKDFQDNWAVGYMKDPGAVEAYQKALKDFQDNWNVSYMKAMKDFQDNWNVSYAKNFQDNWNVGYMKAVKNFQDNWATSYMR